MRMVLQTVICWGVIATVLPSVRVDLNSSLRKRARFRAWLQSRTQRDLHSSSLASETDPEILIGPHHREETDPVELRSSFRPVIRSRRTTVNSAKRPGCFLSTCALHDLGHHLSQEVTNRSNAPQEKISKDGYGRRRRRSAPPRRAMLTLQAGGLRAVWSSRPAQGVRGQASPPRVA